MNQVCIVLKLTILICRETDMIMLTCFNGVERTEVEFRRLFKEADERYELAAVKRPKGSALAVMTVSWNPKPAQD